MYDDVHDIVCDVPPADADLVADQVPDDSFTFETCSNPNLSTLFNQSDDSIQTPRLNPRQPLRLYQPIYGQHDYMTAGDTVLLVQGDSWCRVILHSHSDVSDAYGGSLYWNYSREDGSHITGGYLLPGESWGGLRGPDKDLDISLAEIIFPQQQ